MSYQSRSNLLCVLCTCKLKICTFYLLRNLPILRTVCHRSCCEFLKLAFCLEICFRVRDERTKSRILSIVYFRVKWISTLLWLSKLVTLLPMRYIFRSSIRNNQQAWQSFHFQKFTGIFSESLQVHSFYFKEWSPKRIFEIKNKSLQILGPQNGPNGFWFGPS